MEMGWGGGGEKKKEREREREGIQSILGKRVIPQAKYVDNFQWPNSFSSGMYIIQQIIILTMGVCMFVICGNGRFLIVLGVHTCLRTSSNVFGLVAPSHTSILHPTVARRRLMESA